MLETSEELRTVWGMATSLKLPSSPENGLVTLRSRKHCKVTPEPARSSRSVPARAGSGPSDKTVSRALPDPSRVMAHSDTMMDLPK